MSISVVSFGPRNCGLAAFHIDVYCVRINVGADQMSGGRGGSWLSKTCRPERSPQFGRCVFCCVCGLSDFWAARKKRLSRLLNSIFEWPAGERVAYVNANRLLCIRPFFLAVDNTAS